MAPLSAIGRAIAAQRGQLLCWVPICLGVGIGGYFALAFEPEGLFWAGVVAAMALLGLLARRLPEDFRPLALAALLVLAGGALAAMRAHMVSAPVLGFRYYGPIEGRVVKIDRSASDALRLTLDHVVLAGMEQGQTPVNVRISLHARQGVLVPVPGLFIGTTGHLAPPSGPVEPGGFDFRRQAWFSRLGAVGYTRVPVLAMAPVAPGGAALRLYRGRMALSAWVRRQLGGDAGAFAAAVMTGDRSAMSRPVIDDLRGANLSHLLAISGLHMGLVTGFVFAALRFAMALIPPLALRLPVRKIAAAGALLAGGAYLALAGANVATERAFIMVSVMFLAVILGRRAITLRAVAVAATVLLVMRPEVLPQPGFQMSFAATVALVSVFRGFSRWQGAWAPRWLRPVMAVIVSSAVAGAATAPFAAAHFNRVADFGLLANLLSVPLMGLLVMPAAVIAVALAPLGLGWVGLAAMAPAIRWILGVAHWVAGLDGALTHVPTPPALVLPLLALGALWVILWRGKGRERFAGLLCMALAFALWENAVRPPVLVADTGGLIGVLGPQGRALNKPRGDGFAARAWLENDGDGASQREAAARAGLSGTAGKRFVVLGGQRIVHLSGRGAREQVEQACAEAALVIITVNTDQTVPGCNLYDPHRLRRTGALAITPSATGLDVLGASDATGRRLWNN